jgi:hypothetical protein
LLRVTRERKVGIIANTNDTYEYIEGATSNQRKKGTNYKPFFLWLLVAPSMYSYVSLVFVRIRTFLSLVTRSSFDVFVRIIGMCYKCRVVRNDIYVNDHDRLTLNLRLGNGLI